MTSRAIVHLGTLVIAISFVAWFLIFKIADTDFWWHVAAGRWIWQHYAFPELDPFAHTREGLPYVATHEWLTQVIFYGIFHTFGPRGIIALRIIAALAAFGLVLSLDRKNIWPNVFLAVFGVLIMRQSLLERPQLLTNVVFAASLMLSLRLLQKFQEGRELGSLKWMMIAWLILQVLWVNLHGGAAFLSLILLGCTGVELMIDGWRDSHLGRSILYLAILGCGLLAAMLMSPNGIHTFTYVWFLLQDQTIDFIQEWSPHPWPHYLVQIGPFWIIALIAILWTRTQWLTLGLLLIAFGILSRMSARHEVLFVLTAIACTIASLRMNDRWQLWMEKIQQRWWLVLLITLMLTGGLILLNWPYRAFLLRRDLTGSSTYEPARAAFNFVEREKIAGKMFNTYSFGGYLLYRGADSGRKIFVDGRNVDYGYAFLEKALRARKEENALREIVRDHGVTYAIIEYTPGPSHVQAEFTYLNHHPSWTLVFIDDWGAVYMQRTPENAAVIAQHEYMLITPGMLIDGSPFPSIPASKQPQFQKELERMAENDDRGIRGLLLLARHHRNAGRFDEAWKLAEEAAKRSPYRHEPYEIFATIAEAKGEWVEAAKMYEKFNTLGKSVGISIRDEHLAEVLEKAGN